MLDHPLVLMCLPAALAITGFFCGYCLRAWMVGNQAQLLDDIFDQLRSIKRLQHLPDQTDSVELEIEIDGLHAEISELKSLIEIQESENELACLTIQRQRSQIIQAKNASGTSPVWRATEEDLAAVILQGRFDSEQLDTGYGGVVKRDRRLGLVYTRPPLICDNLQNVSGITSGLEDQLNALGVYTFEQIMLWDEQNIEEFSMLLDALPDGYTPDEWIGLARQLYEARNQLNRSA